MSAKDLGAKLVEAVLAERPEEASGRAAVLVNGLGATKYEELFVLYGHVSDLLTNAGLELIAPEIGELVTSLDMRPAPPSLPPTYPSLRPRQRPNLPLGSSAPGMNERPHPSATIFAP